MLNKKFLKALNHLAAILFLAIISGAIVQYFSSLEFTGRSYVLFFVVYVSLGLLKEGLQRGIYIILGISKTEQAGQVEEERYEVDKDYHINLYPDIGSGTISAQGNLVEDEFIVIRPNNSNKSIDKISGPRRINPSETVQMEFPPNLDITVGDKSCTTSPTLENTSGLKEHEVKIQKNDVDEIIDLRTMDSNKFDIIVSKSQKGDKQ